MSEKQSFEKSETPDNAASPALQHHDDRLNSLDLAATSPDERLQIPNSKPFEIAANSTIYSDVPMPIFAQTQPQAEKQLQNEQLQRFADKHPDALGVVTEIARLQANRGYDEGVHLGTEIAKFLAGHKGKADYNKEDWAVSNLVDSALPSIGPRAYAMGKEMAEKNQSAAPKDAALGGQPRQGDSMRPREFTNGALPLNLDSTRVPDWLQSEIAKSGHNRAGQWLPSEVLKNGLEATYTERMQQITPETRSAIEQMHIPHWMVALMPAPGSVGLDQNGPYDKFQRTQDHIREITNLQGQGPSSAVGTRAEQLLAFAGSAELPTPLGLGDEGCAAAMSHYVFAQLKNEFPQLADMPRELTTTVSHNEVEKYIKQFQNQHPGILEIKNSLKTQELRPGDIQAGDFTIANKPGGTHVFGWSRVPKEWRWAPDTIMAIGNTGLSKFGEPHVNLAQEYLTQDRTLHNPHGRFNSGQIVYKNENGRQVPDLSDPATNVYAVKGSNVVIIRFL